MFVGGINKVFYTDLLLTKQEMLFSCETYFDNIESVQDNKIDEPKETKAQTKLVESVH